MLFHLIAQTQPPDFGPWLSNLFYGVGLLTACVVLFKHLKGSPSSTEISGQPLTVKAAARFATKEEHSELKGVVEAMGREIKEGFASMDGRRSGSIDALRLEIKAEIHGVHERVNEVLRGVSRLEGRSER